MHVHGISVATNDRVEAVAPASCGRQPGGSSIPCRPLAFSGGLAARADRRVCAGQARRSGMACAVPPGFSAGGPLHEIPPCRRDQPRQPGSAWLSPRDQADHPEQASRASGRPRPVCQTGTQASRGEWPRQPPDQHRLPVALSGRRDAVLSIGTDRTSLLGGRPPLARRPTPNVPGMSQARVQHATG